MNVVTQLTQFVDRDVINENTTDLAVRCSTGSVELSCVAIDTPLGVVEVCGIDDVTDARLCRCRRSTAAAWRH